MTCPACSNDVIFVGLTIAPPLAVCPACGRSVVVTNGSARIAHGDDTHSLTESQIIALRQLRPVK